MNSNQPQPGSSGYSQPTPTPPRHSQQQSQSTCFISRCPLFTQSVSPGQVIVLENVTSSTVHLHVDPALQPCNATIFAPANAPRDLNQVPCCQIINQPIFYVTPILSTEPADNVNGATGNNLSTNTQQPPNRKEHHSSDTANTTSTDSELSYPASTSSSNIGLEFSYSDFSDSETESVDGADGGSKESATQTYD